MMVPPTIPEDLEANSTTPLLQSSNEPRSLLRTLSRTLTLSKKDVEKGAQTAAWLLVMVVTHVFWGLYPVAARFLQTQAKPPAPTLRLVTYINLIAAVTLFLTYSLPQQTYKLCKKKQTTADITSEGRAGAWRTSFWSRVRALVVLSLGLAGLGAGTIFGSRFTSAYIVQLIFMSAPLFVALLNSVFLKTPLPDRLFPALGLTGIGSVLVVYGGFTASAGSLTSRDGIGIAITLGATLTMAVYMVWVQKTRGLLTESAILYVNYFTMLAFAPLLSTLFEAGDWEVVLGWNAWALAALVFMGVGVYVVANLLQQFCIRQLGAAMFATFISVRLVASILASTLLLGERITNWVEWVGVGIVIAAVTWYLLLQYLKSRRVA